MGLKTPGIWASESMKTFPAASGLTLCVRTSPERWEQTSEAWVSALAAPGGTWRKPAPNACVPDRCILYHVMNSLTAGPASASAVVTPENRAQRPRSCVQKMQITIRQIRIYSD